MEDILAVIVITSSPWRYEFRQSIRQTWGQQNVDFKIVFLIGNSKDRVTRKLIKLEHELYGDIVQGSFIDAFRNETYKHVMALKWAVFYCPTAKFIIKTNDDIIVNMDELKTVLHGRFFYNNIGNLIACRLNKDLVVKRSKHHVYYVSKKEYANKYFPSFCSGKFYNNYKLQMELFLI